MHPSLELQLVLTAQWHDQSTHQHFAVTVNWSFCHLLTVFLSNYSFTISPTKTVKPRRHKYVSEIYRHDIYPVNCCNFRCCCRQFVSQSTSLAVFATFPYYIFNNGIYLVKFTLEKNAQQKSCLPSQRPSLHLPRFSSKQRLLLSCVLHVWTSYFKTASNHKASVCLCRIKDGCRFE